MVIREGGKFPYDLTASQKEGPPTHPRSHSAFTNFSYFQGIEWIHIDYFNNAVICELIDAVSETIL